MGAGRPGPPDRRPLPMKSRAASVPALKQQMQWGRAAGPALLYDSIKNVKCTTADTSFSIVVVSLTPLPVTSMECGGVI